MSKYKVKIGRYSEGTAIIIIPEKDVSVGTFENNLMEDRDLDFLPTKMITAKKMGYRYGIIGERLTEYVNWQNLNKEDAKNIIKSVAKAINICDSHLIDVNSIILSPETICKNGNDYYFVAAPNLQGDLYEEIVKLILFIMRNTDKKDRDSMLFIYNMFRETAKEDFNIEDLLKIIEKEGGKTMQVAETTSKNLSDKFSLLETQKTETVITNKEKDTDEYNYLVTKDDYDHEMFAILRSKNKRVNELMEIVERASDKYDTLCEEEQEEMVKSAYIYNILSSNYYEDIEIIKYDRIGYMTISD